MHRAALRRALPLLLAALAGGCDQPPTREMTAAQNALAEARQQEAALYAPDLLKEAETAFEAARQKVEQKDYRGALSSAVDAAEKARSAGTAVPSAKMLLKGGAEVAQAEAQAALDEVAAVREEAAKAKVPDAAFEAVAPRVAEVEAALKAVTDHLAQGDLIAAQKAGAELKPIASSVKTDFRAAVDKWLQEHPKGRKPAKKK